MRCSLVSHTLLNKADASWRLLSGCLLTALLASSSLLAQDPVVTPVDPLDAAVRRLPFIPTPTSRGELANPNVGNSLTPTGARANGLIDLSATVGGAVGGATVDDETLLGLQSGHHDPNQRGFTLQTTELTVAGDVDPHLNAAGVFNIGIDGRSGETIFELEESYFRTTYLHEILEAEWSENLEIKGGMFYADFGRVNRQHAHMWDWLDQPVIIGRMFGIDGLRGLGLRGAWLAPTERYNMFYFGAHNAHGETLHSFYQAGEGAHSHGGHGGHDEHEGEEHEGEEEDEGEEEHHDEHAILGSTIGGWAATDNTFRDAGDLLYTTRWETSWVGGAAEDRTWLLGLSGAFGPNNTGTMGYTRIYGTDLTMKWVPEENQRGWPYLIWQSEVLGRHYYAQGFEHEHEEDGVTEEEEVDGRRLIDWGLYTQLLYGWKPNWSVGLRYEYADGSGASLDGDFEEMARSSDVTRDRRSRFSPLVVWTPSHFTRLRLQYNLDRADSLREEHGGRSHGFWLGIDFMYGVHPAHAF